METAPVSRSTSVTTRSAPKGKVKLGGSQKWVATSPGSVLGGSFMARYAAAAIPLRPTVLPDLLQVHSPLAKVTSSDSKSMAPNFLILVFRSCSAKYRAVPPTAVERLPKVPMPYCTSDVSPCDTRTSSIPTPNSSPTIWAKVVSSPCPCGEIPVSTVTLPDGSILTVALSQPPAGVAGEGPNAQISP